VKSKLRVVEGDKPVSTFADLETLRIPPDEGGPVEDPQPSLKSRKKFRRTMRLGPSVFSQRTPSLAGRRSYSPWCWCPRPISTGISRSRAQ
jgi:hypothetical protein